MSTAIHQQLDETIRHALASAVTPPQQRQSPPLARWTLKCLVEWVKQQFGIDCCRESVRKVLKQLGFSWKKAHKLLNKDKPDQRAAFLERLQGLLADALHERCLLIYIDEAHIHLDTDAGYGWAIRGERFWVSSSSPGRAKVSFYGVYLYNLGQVRIFADDKANQDHTVDLEPLPAYSPDLMPVEHLWQWLREDVTYHACYATASELKQRVEQFQHQINATPLAIADRLWVKNHLDPEEEKLRVST